MSSKYYIQYHINPNVKYYDVFDKNISLDGKYDNLVYSKKLFRYNVRVKCSMLRCGAGWCGNNVQYFMGLS